MQENIFIQSTTGLKISSSFNYPIEANDNNTLAIVCPGYLDSKDYFHLKNLAEQLCEKGYTVCRFNPSGTWDSEGDISIYSTTQYLKDVNDILNYCLSKKSYKEILIAGHSRGGQISLLSAARDNRITKVLAIMPSSSKTISGQRYIDWEKDGFEKEEREDPNAKDGVSIFKVPYSHVNDRKNYYVSTDVKNIRVPILYVVGSDDEIVLPEYVQELYENSNQPKKIITLQGVGHTYRNREDCKNINKLIIENII